jgi:hypothetical protein
MSSSVKPAAITRAAPGDQRVRLDCNRHGVVRVEATLREFGSDLADSRFDHFVLRSHGPLLAPNLGFLPLPVKFVRLNP